MGGLSGPQPESPIVVELEHIESTRFSCNSYRGLPDAPAFEIVAGDLPVVVSAPHAVTHEREGRVKPSDDYTGAMALVLAHWTGCHAIVASRFDGCDPNWDPIEGSAYKQALVAHVLKAGVRFCLDAWHGVRIALNRRLGHGGRHHGRVATRGWGHRRAYPAGASRAAGRAPSQAHRCRRCPCGEKPQYRELNHCSRVRHPLCAGGGRNAAARAREGRQRDSCGGEALQARDAWRGAGRARIRTRKPFFSPCRRSRRLFSPARDAAAARRAAQYRSFGTDFSPQPDIDCMQSSAADGRARPLAAPR